jgi:UDP-N-acetylglucosamine diphosphorylase / glucose-1-phosphate thymidylyltransferase / UDP-N-acetylgalactosamine diphosphorylase / glucosamine-1-phosphate N-acetyltransferase / galactosamine-1-phosphate N-acetyltransferase
MQVILLAAGVSSRLDPIQDKNLLEFCGKPLVEHQIAALKKAKLRDIVVVGNPENLEGLKQVAKRYNNVAVVQQEKDEDGMCGAVLAAAKLIKHKNVMILSTNDVMEDGTYEKVVEASKEAQEGLIVGKKMLRYFPGGYLVVDKKGFLQEIVEKPGEGKQPSDLVNLVLHVYNNFPEFLGYLKKVTGKKDEKYEKALDQYIKKGEAKMSVFRYHGEWQAIKFPWHVLRMQEYFMQRMEPKIDKSAKIAKTAVIRGEVHIGPRVQVYENAIIQGPAYISEGCIIGNNALVRESMLGKNCVIGYATEVTRSYLNHDVWTHSTYLGDSVIDHNVSFGAGTVIGNLRFDEENIRVTIKNLRHDSNTNKFGAIVGAGARFGINSCTNPGVKVGQDTFVGGNVLVDRDIPNNKLVLLEQKLKIVPNTKKASVAQREETKKKLK